jgi:hypothetical protein
MDAIDDAGPDLACADAQFEKTGSAFRHSKRRSALIFAKIMSGFASAVTDSRSIRAPVTIFNR